MSTARSLSGEQNTCKVQPVVESSKKYRDTSSHAGRIRELLNHEFAQYPEKTSRALAKHCGVSEQAVYKWRRTGQISRDHIAKVAKFFERPSGWLLSPQMHGMMAEESHAPYGDKLDPRETRIVAALRAMPPMVSAELERHMLALAKIINRP